MVPIRLGEIATAKDGTAEARSAAIYGQSSTGAQSDAVGIMIKKSKGYSTSQVAAKVLAKH